MDAAGWPWPEHVLLDEKKMPRFISTVAELKHELQVGCHMNEVVVFPGGLHALGHEASLNSEIASAAGFGDPDSLAQNTAYDVLANLADMGQLERFKGKVQFRHQKESRKDTPAGSWKNGCLTEKWDALKGKCPDEAKSSVYLAEIRMLERQAAEDTTLRPWRKSTMKTTMRERMHKLGMDVRSMLYWDDYSEGLFCGAGSSGYDLHADCIPTSNIGSVFAGHKLLAIWSFPDDTKKVLREHGREQFVQPLTPGQVLALEGACCTALAPPGSIYIFSGACAHSVCNVGFGTPIAGPPRPSLVISSYEAFIGLHMEHIEAMVKVCNTSLEDDSETDEDIVEFEEDVADEAWTMQQRLDAGKVSEETSPGVQAALDFLKVRSPGIKRLLEKKASKAAEEQLQLKRQRCTKLAEAGYTQETATL